MKWTGRREIARSDWDEEKLKIIIWTVRELVVIEPLASKLSSSYKTFPACIFLIWSPRPLQYMERCPERWIARYRESRYQNLAQTTTKKMHEASLHSLLCWPRVWCVFACSVCLINAPFHCKTLSQPEQQTESVTRAPPGGEYVAIQFRHRLAGPQSQGHLKGAGDLPLHEQQRSVRPPESRFHLFEALFVISYVQNLISFQMMKC